MMSSLFVLGSNCASDTCQGGVKPRVHLKKVYVSHNEKLNIILAVSKSKAYPLEIGRNRKDRLVYTYIFQRITNVKKANKS